MSLPGWATIRDSVCYECDLVFYDDVSTLVPVFRVGNTVLNIVKDCENTIHTVGVINILYKFLQIILVILGSCELDPVVELDCWVWASVSVYSTHENVVGIIDIENLETVYATGGLILFVVALGLIDLHEPLFIGSNLVQYILDAHCDVLIAIVSEVVWVQLDELDEVHLRIMNGLSHCYVIEILQTIEGCAVLELVFGLGELPVAHVIGEHTGFCSLETHSYCCHTPYIRNS